MRCLRSLLASLILSVGLGASIGTPVIADDNTANNIPAPFDNPAKVRIALVRYLSSGDFFDAYRRGVERQSEALGIRLRVMDSVQDAALQADMINQVIALGVDGIIVEHGVPSLLQPAVQRALDKGIKVVAFDVAIDHPEVPQITQSDFTLARLALEHAIAENGTSFNAGYVYVPDVDPLDRRDEVWREYKDLYPGIIEKAQFGNLDSPIAISNAELAINALQENPDITVMFAPYDEFARGVELALDELDMNGQVKIYGADISNEDITSMRKRDSAWAATAATNPASVGEVSVRALAMLIANEAPGARIVVPPTLITREMLIEQDILSMNDLEKQIPSFAHADIVAPDWMPLPLRPDP